LGAAASEPGLARKGNFLFVAGCLICGTWVLGPLGAALIIWGLLVLRRAKQQGEKVAPWTVILIGGFILVDTSVNFFAWGLDLLPAHDTLVGRALWHDYGRLVDGGYMFFYNTKSIGGVGDSGEKSVQVGMVLMAMPIKMAGAWGFMKMKRWGLQWTLIAYWMYFTCWMIYATNMLLDFPLRFGPSSYGVVGFWLLVNVPFLGPILLLPYLHTARRDLWTD
jgi:hypothetical protein